MNNSASPLIPRIAFAMTIFGAKFFGLFPFNWDEQCHRLAKHRFPLLYPTMFVTILSAAVIYSNYVVFPQTMSYLNSVATKTILYIMYIFYVFSILMTYVRHYSTLDDIESVCVDCISIWRTVDRLGIVKTTIGWRFYVLVIINCLAIPFLQFALIFWRMAYLDRNHSKHYLFYIIIAFPNIITSLVPNLFHNLMITVVYVLRLLNTEIRTVMLATTDLASDSPFRIQQQYCDLSDRLDAIAQVHLQVIRVAQKISNLLEINVVIWIMVKACIALLMCFTCYMYCMGWAFVEGFSIPIQVLVSGVLSLVLMLSEMTMLVNVCAMAMNEVIGQ